MQGVDINIRIFIFSPCIHLPWLYSCVIPRSCSSSTAFNSFQFLTSKVTISVPDVLLLMKRGVTIMWMVVSWNKGSESCLACRSWTSSVICSSWTGTQLAGWKMSLCWPVQLSQQNSLDKPNYTSKRFLFLVFILSAEVPLKRFCQWKMCVITGWFCWQIFIHGQVLRHAALSPTV